ncbi:MAG: dihydroorotate dehydrogenase electron transfer subunit [Planctomycetes bacterium]|nr:dihydroorotate dehydrogenase electron transfer subunit [Planctomycetota bacterium]
MTDCSQNHNNHRCRGEFKGSITKQLKINHDFYCITVGFPESAHECLAAVQAGQFVEIAVGDFNQSRQAGSILRRPFSIAGQNLINIKDKNKCSTLTLEFIYQVLGPGTKSLMQKKTGDEVSIIGPLGNGFTFPDDTTQKIILIGGGVGLPPLYFWAKQLHRAGYQNIVAFAGARRKDLFAGEISEDKFKNDNPLLPQKTLKEFACCETNCIIATDDGSIGYLGSVVQALEEYLSLNTHWKKASIYACGPHGMLKAIAASAQRHNMPCEVCMEAYMACGIGVCQSCVVPVQNIEKTNINIDEQKYNLVCSDGPVFNAKQIVW